MIIDQVRRILADTLFLDPGRAALHAGSPLLGAIPELDSMAVVSVVEALEDHFKIRFEDEEIVASSFDTVGSLAALVESKLP